METAVGTWIAIIISASGASATLTFIITKAALDNTNERLTKIENTLAVVVEKMARLEALEEK